VYSKKPAKILDPHIMCLLQLHSWNTFAPKFVSTISYHNRIGFGTINTEKHILKDKTIALKIFQLGLKKYGHIAEYLIEYIDFMSHTNGEYPKVFPFRYFIPMMMMNDHDKVHEK
jgi:hypothetical protein